MMNLEELKAKADELGIKYSGNISAATLQERIDAHILAQEPEVVTPVNKIGALRKEATKLVRVIITPMDTLKKDYNGEFFQVANKILNIKRFIPFGVSTHIESVLLEQLREKQFRMSETIKGTTNPVSRLVPAYAIQVLPPLTPEELENLKQAQLARNSIN